MKQVVVWDPTGIYWDGAVVEEVTAKVIQSRGGAVLPCAPEHFELAGFSGFAKRSWGAGYPLSTGISKIHAPIAMFTPGDPNRNLHWAARLMPSGNKGEVAAGVIRLAATQAYWNQHRAVISEGSTQRNLVEVGALGKPDEHGGWTIGGSALLTVPSPGFYGFGIYGFAMGMQLAWLAVTLTS